MAAGIIADSSSDDQCRQASHSYPGLEPAQRQGASALAVMVIGAASRRRDPPGLRRQRHASAAASAACGGSGRRRGGGGRRGRVWTLCTSVQDGELEQSNI